MIHMADDYNPNAALFGEEEPVDPQEQHIEHTFGRNPNRTSLMSDLFGSELMESVMTDEELPEEAKAPLILKMAINSALDIVMESLDPETREEVAASVDGYLGMCLVNKRFEVDLFGELAKALASVEQDEGESDEEYQQRLSEMEDAWWNIPQPKLNNRNPDDAISEEARRYGLD